MPCVFAHWKKLRLVVFSQHAKQMLGLKDVCSVWLCCPLHVHIHHFIPSGRGSDGVRTEGSDGPRASAGRREVQPTHGEGTSGKISTPAVIVYQWTEVYTADSPCSQAPPTGLVPRLHPLTLFSGSTHWLYSQAPPTSLFSSSTHWPYSQAPPTGLVPRLSHDVHVHVFWTVSTLHNKSWDWKYVL